MQKIHISGVAACQKAMCRPAVGLASSPDILAQSFPRCQISLLTARLDKSSPNVAHTANTQVRLHGYESQRRRQTKSRLGDAVFINYECGSIFFILAVKEIMTLDLPPCCLE